MRSHRLRTLRTLRTLPALAACALVAAGLAACGTGSGGSGSGKSISIWEGYTGAEQTEFTKLVAAYEKKTGVKINVLRSGAVRTESFAETFGGDFYGFVGQFVPDRWMMKAEEVGRAAFALCSGMFDGVSGQVITVDHGTTFTNGIAYIYERRQELGL